MKPFAACIAAILLSIAFLQTSQAAEKHLIYIQGCCVESKDSPLAQDYHVIVKKLQDSGFDVFFELRTAEEADGDAKVQAYAAKIAGYVRELIKKGTAPEDITVSGFSQGSRTVLVASGLIANPKVNYVLLAGCPYQGDHDVTIDYARVTGRVLSIVDNKDYIFDSCEGRLPNASQFREIFLDSGEGHKVFRLTDEAYLKLWMEPLENWAKGQ